MTFKLYDVPSGGTALFTEAQTLTVTNGVFSAQLGATALLTADLFSGASAYLGITVSPDSEMTPRDRLAMSPYVFASAQLVQHADVRVNAGSAYSTFTVTGNWLMPGGLEAGTGAFSGALTASSGTFTATGLNQYALQSSSGVRMLAGTLTLASASGGLDAHGTGVKAATAAFTATGAERFSVQTSSGIDVRAGTLRVRDVNGVQADSGVTAASAAVRGFLQNEGDIPPLVAPAGTGRLYFDSATNALMASENAGAYARVVSPSNSLNIWDTEATSALTNQGRNLPSGETELDQTYDGCRVTLNCDDLGDQVAMRYNMRNFTARARTITIKITEAGNTANVLAFVDIDVTATANVTYTGEIAYAPKPAWCVGTKQISVYTAGGNGSDDFIFKRIGLIWKP